MLSSRRSWRRWLLLFRVTSRRRSSSKKRSAPDRLELGREVSQDRSLLDKTIAGNVCPPFPDLEDGLDHIVDVALGIDPPRDGQPHQLHGSGRFLPALSVSAAEH